METLATAPDEPRPQTEITITVHMGAYHGGPRRNYTLTRTLDGDSQREAAVCLRSLAADVEQLIQSS